MNRKKGILSIRNTKKREEKGIYHFTISAYLGEEKRSLYQIEFEIKIEWFDDEKEREREDLY